MNAVRRRVIAGTVTCLFACATTLSAAGTGEFCSFPNAQAVPVSHECAVKFLPNSNWLTQFNTWLALNKTSGAMACFGPGTYVVPSVLATNTSTTIDTNRLVLRNVQNLRLCAPTAGAVFRGKTVNANATQLTDYAYTATLKVADSTGVSIKGMEFQNTSDYAMSFSHHVTRAIGLERSSGLSFIGVKATGAGKQVVNVNDTVVSFSATAFKCAYFCISAERGSGPTKPSIAVANSSFVIQHARNAADDHPAIYANYSDFDITDSSFDFVTGEGFVSGVSSAFDWINLTNVSITGETAQGRPKMFGWIPTHPNYYKLQINHTGPLSVGRPYFCVAFGGSAGCETGFENAGNQGAVFRHRATTASAFVVASPPPSQVKKLLFFNASGTDDVWTQQSVVKNQANLVFRASLAWSGMGSGLGGWLDSDDGMLNGDFSVVGQPRLLLFNSETVGGALSVRSLSSSAGAGSMQTETVVEWTEPLRVKLAGWHDPGDKVLAGDFTGFGRSQLLFANYSASPGAFHIAAVDAPTSELQTVKLIPWTPALASSLAGWIDTGDKLVCGDFAGTGRAQLMFLNTAGGAEGAASLLQYDAASNSFQTLNTVPWSKLTGSTALWTNQLVKTLTGDFLGLGRDQLVLLNPSGSGVALSFWSFDATAGSFTEVHKMNWSASEIPNLNGFLDANDRQLGL
jgi:hypothetical protein